MYKHKILVVDDDVAILEATQLLLEDAGYYVKTNTGNIRIATWKIFPDLILLDLWMSGIDGKNLCEQLKRQQKTKHIPVILISANNNVATVASTVGADDFIFKPFAKEELLGKVSKLVTKKFSSL